MPKLRKEKSKLKKVTARVDENLGKQMDEAMDKMGMDSRAEFVRMALTEKVRRILHKAEKLVKKEPPLAAALALPFFPLEALPIMLVFLWIALMCYYTVRLVRAESPEEQTRAQRVLAGCVIAGVLMAIAKPVAFWATGWRYDPDTKKWTDKDGNIVDIPGDLVTAVNRVLDLLMYIGVVVVVGGMIYSGIQLSRRTSSKITAPYRCWPRLTLF